MPNENGFDLKRTSLICACVAGLTLALQAEATDVARYQMPPQAIIDMVDAPLIPQTSLSPANDWIMLLERPALPTVSELAQPELRLAGVRINPRNNDKSRNNHAIGIRFIKLADRTERVALISA